MKHPKESAVECFLPFLVIVGGLTALAALFPLLGGENPVGSVVWFLSECWEGLSPLGTFIAALWGFHLVSYLLVGSFAKDVWSVAAMVQRLAVCIWRWFFNSWASPALCLEFTPPLSLVRFFPRCLPSWLATGWRPGDSVHLE